MKRLLKSCVTISVLSSIVIAPLFVGAGKAAAGTKASYAGFGASAGVTNGGVAGGDANLGGNITARFRLGETGFSARGNVIFSEDTSAIVPEISKDFSIGKKTNFFVTGGVSLVEKENNHTPLGNRDSITVGAGLETEVSKNVILYGNVKTGINAYEKSPASAVNLNAGVGIRMY
jgi:opacity protein-like surface antigen